ncbi:uncharacterized protein HMPREF1541_11074 [Cyphellophora europaea CBS 101466]|uniref:Methyltransferase type 11 domain-containing protein n=1 Tax=Cyphellophora europaea (strain CBS 101466) TaxID=1220924 RepID=W2S7D4_CYPE1|nr:uncharacterized protein HMPREF1541_11074 [Cyphellophora europaea CBS 101466]ETN43943.1 hypothetical protein HMPREF1541_11074 [Cyphellophora europaea CBS 101466]
MAQNVYDTEEFFRAYSYLQRSREGLDGAGEWPTMRNLVGSVSEADIIDVGCGYGWFCRWASEGGARSVHGIDVSKRMLERAQSYPADPQIKYMLGDLESIDLAANTYDLVYSSLTLHYLPDLRSVIHRIATCLKSGGRFVFSVEHPVWTASPNATWQTDSAGNGFWPLKDYAKEGLRVSKWLGAGEVHKYHHRTETYLSSLIESGFTIDAVRESWEGMDDSCKAEHKDSGHRPYFLIVRARKGQ